MTKRAIFSLLVLVLAISPAVASAQVTHIVNQVDTSFTPRNIVIMPGDTVRWVWSSLSHTVTSGTGFADPNAGLLFDAPLSVTTPQFEYQFDDIGTFRYFCRPHEILDMKGRIDVVDPTTRAPQATPAVLRVRGVEPNPFNPRTSVVFTLGEPASVSVHVYDARGRLVRALVTGVQMDAGERSVVWDGDGDEGEAAASGVYFFSVRAQDYEQTIRGTLVR